MTSSLTFQTLDENSIPSTPVIVTISKTKGIVQGEIDREMLVVGGGMSLPEHRGPMSVPDALAEAQELARMLKPVGGSGVFIRIADHGLWNDEWGELH